MSEGPDLPETEALAAEYALGVLSRTERAEAERRASSDPDFAALVETWGERLQPLLDGVAPVAPPAGVWSAIARTLPANENSALQGKLRFWRFAGVGSMGVAAASLAAAVMLANQGPQIAPPAAAPQLLNASLAPQQTGAQPLFIAAYDPMRHALIITSLVPPGADPEHVHELWIIPADGKPRSLGLVEPGQSKVLPLAPVTAPMLAEGSSLAVSVEPPGGSPTKDAPSGPIAATGRLSKI